MTTVKETRKEVLEEAEEVLENKANKAPVIEIDDELRAKLAYPVWATTAQALR